MKSKASLCMASATLIGAMAMAPMAFAEYPERAVEVTVPFSAGGGADTSQRTFNKYAEPIVGQSMVVVNRPGAGGTVGWATFVNSAPDGYSLSITTEPFNIIPALVQPSQTGYRLDQFAHACVYASVPDVVAVRADSQFQTFEDLVQFAQANPGQITAANTGALGADFMTMLLIQDKAGVEFTQVPFTGGSQALQGVLSGTVDMMVASALFAVAQEGQLRTLATGAAERDVAMADVPTLSELGYDVVSARLRALALPAGTPDEIVEYWGDVCEQVTSNPEFRNEMQNIGQPVVYFGPEKAEELIGDFVREMQTLVDTYKLAN